MDRRCDASQLNPTPLTCKAEANYMRTQQIRQQVRTYRYAKGSKEQARITGTLKAKKQSRGSGIARRTKSEIV